MSQFIRENVKIGDRVVTLETGRIAKQAQGSCLVTCGESIVLVTACGTSEPRPGIDFLPLSVEYELTGLLERTLEPGAETSGFNRLLPSTVTGPRLLNDEIVSDEVVEPTENEAS